MGGQPVAGSDCQKVEKGPAGVTLTGECNGSGRPEPRRRCAPAGVEGDAHSYIKKMHTSEARMVRSPCQVGKHRTIPARPGKDEVGGSSAETRALQVSGTVLVHDQKVPHRTGASMARGHGHAAQRSEAQLCEGPGRHDSSGTLANRLVHGMGSRFTTKHAQTRLRQSWSVVGGC